MNRAIAAGVADGNVYDMEEMVSSALALGENPKDLLEAMMAGLKTCGDRFEAGECFLPELMGAGEAFTVGMEVLAPKLAPGDRTSQGTMSGPIRTVGRPRRCASRNADSWMGRKASSTPQ